MKAAIYLRFSVDRTGEELGIERHREDTVALVKRRELVFAGEYADNDTSAKGIGKRPGYAALMAAVQRGEIDAIVVWQSSRLWRNRRERAEGIEILRDYHVSVLAVKGPEFDMTTAYGRGMAGMLGEFDTMEIEVKGERQTRENQQRADRGLPPRGRRAFGYDKTGAKQVRAEAAAVKRAYAAFLGGASLAGIARDLNRAGHTTTMGGAWEHNSVSGMLRNARNAGLRVYKGQEVGKGTWRPIVAEEVYRAALDVLRAPERRTNTRGSAMVHLGTKLYLCGRCPDQTLTCSYRGSKARGDQLRVYRCPVCYLSRSADLVDNWVTQVVTARLRRPDLATLLAAAPGQGEDTAELRTEAAALRVRLNALADNLELTEAVLARRERAIRGRLSEIERALAEAGKGSAAGALLGARDPGQAWLDQRDLARRQSVVRDLMTIRVMPIGPGRRPFDPDSIQIS